MKFLLYLITLVPLIKAILAYSNNEKYVQPLSVTIMFTMAVCTIAICDSIEKKKVN